MANEPTQWVLITGASSGLGRGIALELAAAGFALLLTGRDREQLERTRRRCTWPGRHQTLVFDLGDTGRIYPKFAGTLREQGIKVTGFVHCAGVACVQPARLTALSTVSVVFDINLLACMEIVRTLLDLDPGKKVLNKLIFVSSVAARIGEKGAAVYCASKGALEAFALSLADELSPEVDIGIVAPGMVRTEMTEKYLADEKTAALLAQKYPLGIGEVENIAPVVTFLMSDQGVKLNGRALSVDGGRCVA